MANQWFKMYGGEFLSDPKIQGLNGDERSCWLTILCLASASTIEGRIEFLNLTSLYRMSGVNMITNDNEVDVITKFQQLKMLKKNSDGSIDVINWNKRQERSMTAYERVKKHRQNKAISRDDNAMITTLITNDNANDNCRIEENRIEENRIDINTNTTSNKKAKVSRVRNTPKQALEVVEVKKDIPLQEEKSDPMIPVVIDLFAKHVNPNCARMYGNKIQREAVKNLIDTYTFPMVEKFIVQYLPNTNKQPYFPNITTPAQLRDNWVKLFNALHKKKGNEVEIIN